MKKRWPLRKLQGPPFFIRLIAEPVPPLSPLAATRVADFPPALTPTRGKSLTADLCEKLSEGGQSLDPAQGEQFGMKEWVVHRRQHPFQL